jgi:hypothetical protein
MSNNSIGSILKTGSASDYISIKKQTTIKKEASTIPVPKFESNNFLFNNTTPTCRNYLRSATSFDLLNNFRTGQQNCCDISFNKISGLT